MRSVLSWVLAAVVAAVTLALLPGDWGWPARWVAAWDAAVVVLLGRSWFAILRADAEHTRRRAVADDPGAVGLLLIPLLASVASFGSTLAFLRDPNRYMPIEPRWVVIALAAVAIAGAWLLVHTEFALHYARLYYAAGDGPGGLGVPDPPPDDLDFAYFAFTIGMSYAASDVAIFDRGIRRVVLGHALLSFLYNTVVLAVAVSIVFGRFG